MLVLGLLILAAAVVVGVAGVAANTGAAHQLPGGVALFGYHINTSTGKLFFFGLVIGAIGTVGLLMMADGLRRNAALRRELFRFRREARSRSRRSAPAATAPTAPVATAPTAPAEPLVAAGSARPASGSAPTSTNGGSTVGRMALKRRLSGLRPQRPAAKQ
jgi:uncharacterized membrane protein YciS (DUF1049 family)